MTSHLIDYFQDRLCFFRRGQQGKIVRAFGAFNYCGSQGAYVGEKRLARALPTEK